MDENQQQRQETTEQRRPNNLRTGLILASIALAFFVGIFIKRAWFN